MRKKRPIYTFTLIELLVVVAVIGVLCSLLLPALARSRELGKRMVCLNNHKQVGMGFSFYTSSYKETLPFTHNRSYGASFPIVYWFEFIFTELANDRNPYGYWSTNWGKEHSIWKLFLCPSCPTARNAGSPAGWKKQNPIWGSVFYGANTSYNFEALNRGNRSVTNPLTGAIYNEALSNSLALIKTPSKKILVCDHGDTSDGNAINRWWLVAQAAVNGQYLPGGGMSNGGKARFANYGASITGAYLEDWWNGRHAGTSNALFVDGHCAPIKSSDLGDAAYVGAANYSLLNKGGFFSAWDY